MTQHSEEEIQNLISLAKGGDGDAFGQIYDIFFDRIYAYISWRVTIKHEAEDLTQNVFIKCLEGLPKYERRGAPFASWLFRIAHNALANHYRPNTNKDCVEIDEVAGVLAANDNPVEEVMDKLTFEELKSAIRQLTEDQQQVIVMKFLGGLKNEEIANAIGKPVGAIKSLQHRSLAAMARYLKTDPTLDIEREQTVSDLQ